LRIIFTDNYNKQLKKLKRHKKEYENLSDILDIIERADDFNILCKLPIVNIYDFERLKHNLNEYYSFNLNKHGGTIRLIIKPNSSNIIEVYLCFISFEHYKDFDPKKVILND